MTRRIRRLLPLLAVLAGTSAHAQDWRVVDRDGPVKVSSQGQWRPLGEGERVRTGAWLKTGPDATITLERVGTQTRVTIKPRTMIAVAGLQGKPDQTVVLQRWGATTLDVEKRDEPHVQVRTPYLSAVVKGTTLDVEVGRTRSNINVLKGEVEVRDDVRGLLTTIGAGRKARGGLGSGGALTAGNATIERVEPRDVVLPPVGGSRPVTARSVEATTVTAMQMRGTVDAAGDAALAIALDDALAAAQGDVAAGVAVDVDGIAVMAADLAREEALTAGYSAKQAERAARSAARNVRRVLAAGEVEQLLGDDERFAAAFEEGVVPAAFTNSNASGSNGGGGDSNGGDNGDAGANNGTGNHGGGTAGNANGGANNGGAGSGNSGAGDQSGGKGQDGKGKGDKGKGGKSDKGKGDKGGKSKGDKGKGKGSKDKGKSGGKGKSEKGKGSKGKGDKGKGDKGTKGKGKGK